MLRDSGVSNSTREPRVAVIVPVLNRARTVQATLDCVAAQVRPPGELIVVDDGSTDDLSATVRRWETATRPSFPTKLLTQSNRGAAAARNLGIAATPTAELYAFLDSDDRWPNDFLARIVATMNAPPRFVAASCNQVWRDKRLGRDYFRSTRGLTQNAVRWLVRHGGGLLSTSVLKAASVRFLGGFDTDYPTGQDSWLLLRLALKGPWAHCPGEPVVFGRNSTREGEASHLCDYFNDYQRRWADLHERFIECEGGRRVLSDRFCNLELARRWHRAGLQLARQGLTTSANVCFRRSLRYRIRLKTVVAWWKNRAAA